VLELCNRLGVGHEVRYQDLQGVLSLRQIANNIITKLGRASVVDNPQDADTTRDAWSRDLADRVFTLVTAREDRTQWLVFDHFERVKQRDGIIFFSAFAEQIALAATNPNIPNGPRLILIDHGVELTAVARMRAIDARVRPVDEPDVTRFVTMCGLPDASAQATAAALFSTARSLANEQLAQLEADDPGAVNPDPFMQVLGSALQEFLRNPVPSAP
jgi:hypothetical protein